MPDDGIFHKELQPTLVHQKSVPTSKIALGMYTVAFEFAWSKERERRNREEK